MVVVAVNSEHLAQLAEIREMLIGLRLIMILPSLEKDAVAAGHSFRPRLLLDLESDFSVITTVLEKLAEQLHLNNLDSHNLESAERDSDPPKALAECDSVMWEGRLPGLSPLLPHPAK